MEDIAVQSADSKKRKLDSDSPTSFGQGKKIKIRQLLRKPHGEERFEAAEYYFENGLRKVYPYFHTFTTFCKGRWVGKQLLDVFASEFRAHPKKQYELCITSGRLKVNEKQVTIDYILKDGDLIENKVHRHETAVLAAPIKIIHESDELLVIDKPPSIPVHPCGRYRNNTIAYILAKEHGYKNINVLHRLDRLTSGVLMFGLDLKKTRQIEEEIRKQLVAKEYLCRVKGEFPNDPITCCEPISTMSHKIGVCMVDKDGRDCSTLFEKISFNGKTSVVLCKPKTGRMHQIRVHLQYLGFPIINDPIYNDPVFGPTLGKGGEFGKTKEQLVNDLMTIHTRENWLGDGCESHALLKRVTNVEEANRVATMSLSHYTDSKEFKILQEKYKFDPDKNEPEDICYECKLKFRDPQTHDLVMYLHAWKYKGTDYSFESSVPVWAKDEWIES